MHVGSDSAGREVGSIFGREEKGRKRRRRRRRVEGVGSCIFDLDDDEEQQYRGRCFWSIAKGNSNIQ